MPAPFPEKPLLGSIADDFTGATDLASEVMRAGLATVLALGVPDGAVSRLIAAERPEALVIALKSRSIPAEAAVAESLAALAWLQGVGAERIYFKYCSTFDSTDAGNIGPVAEALMQRLGAPATVHAPSFPANGRTVYQGHLFVWSELLSESPMRFHPVNPMTDSNLVRVLARQTRMPVGLLTLQELRGTDAGAALARLVSGGTAHVIADAIEDGDLAGLAAASEPMKLLSGGSAFAGAIARRLRRAGAAGPALAWPSGKAAVIAGSCSVATRRQVARFAENHFAIRLDGAAGDPMAAVPGILAAVLPRLGREPVLVYSSADPETVAAAKAKLGADAGERIEAALAAIAKALVEAGVDRLVVAGGETSGSVVKALGVRALAIGPAIAPGVPWTLALGDRPLALALKSGNFGGEGFFAEAFAAIEERPAA